MPEWDALSSLCPPPRRGHVLPKKHRFLARGRGIFSTLGDLLGLFLVFRTFDCILWTSWVPHPVHSRHSVSAFGSRSVCVTPRGCRLLCAFVNPGRSAHFPTRRGPDFQLVLGAVCPQSWRAIPLGPRCALNYSLTGVGLKSKLRPLKPFREASS